MRKLIIKVIALSATLFALDDAVFEASSFAGAGLSTPISKSTIWANPAALFDGPNISAGTGYTNFWGISELQLFSVNGVMRTRFAGIGIGSFYYGSGNLWAEFTFATAIASPLWKIARAGVRVKYAGISLPSQYESQRKLSLDFGLYRPVGASLKLGVFAQNIFSTKIGDSKPPRTICTGFSFDPASWLTILLDLYATEGLPGRVYVGERVQMADWLSISGGVGGRPTKLYLGTQFRWRNMELSWKGTFHPELGMTNSVNLEWQKK